MIDLLEKWFWWKLGEGRIKSRLERIRHYTAGFGSGKQEIRAAAVQRTINPVKSIEQYIDVMESFVRGAAEQGCDIIVFPEYNFFDLLGVIPGFSWLNNNLNSKASRQAGENTEAEIDVSLIKPLFYSVAAPVQTAVEALMCGLALKYRIHIYSGSYFIQENGGLYNGGAVISREGMVLGRQKKLHLTDFEEKLGIKRGTELEVFRLGIGNFTFPVCMDATYYETFSLARLKGCDIVALPIANNEEYGLYKALRGIWPRVQEAYVYGIKAALNGWLCGLHFTGKAGVFAPIGVTSGGDGVIAISESFEGNALVTGAISLEALYKAREADEYYGDSNPDFERGYYKNFYKGDR